MGAGKPVLLTDAEENAWFPEGACIRIDSGPPEEEMLAAAMLWLAGDRLSAGRIGDRAAAYIRSRHDPVAAARLYWETLLSCAGCAT